MKFQNWKIRPVDDQAVCALMEAGYPYLVAITLAPRGVRTAAEAENLLRRDENLAFDPMDMKGMPEAVRRIRKAVKKHEKIAVFGDYDVDGITSTCIVTDYLGLLGADCIYYIPHRIDDGYGLSCGALQKLRDAGASLVITVDCGITGVEEAAFAKEIGLDLVITDHHECKGVLPDAVAVVNPHQPECTYPFKNLAGVGVALKLVMALGGEPRYERLFRRYCPLAAIGTVADVMSMTGENRTIVYHGLKTLRGTPRVGLHALLREAGLRDKPASSTSIGYVLAPRINAAGRMGRADMAAELFLTKDPARAEVLAKELCELNRERQRVEQEIFVEAQERIEAMPQEARNALVLESDTWHQGVVGIVASRLSEKYCCPSFMIHLSGEVGKGSCRSYGGFNLFSALEQCEDLLMGFGGHELAAGFTIEKKNIPAFRARMNEIARSFLGGAAPISTVEVDALITHPHWITLDAADQLAGLEPYGADNPRPLFCVQGLTIDSIQNVGQNKHMKLRFSKGSTQLDGIFFSMNIETSGLCQGDRVDVLFYLNVNEFRCSRTLQMQLVDIRLSLEPSVREREDLEKMRQFLEGDGITHQGAVHMLPTRNQFAACWRTLQRIVPQEGQWQGDYLPLLRMLEKNLGGTDSFLRAMLCLCVFCERDLLHMECTGDRCVVQRKPVAQKVDLQASPYMQTLEMMIQSRR